MTIFKSATEKHFSKEMEFKLHEKVVKDLTEGNKDLGVWGKAFVDADADEQKAKSLYIKLMVQRYKDQAEAEAEAEAEARVRAEANAKAEREKAYAEELKIIKQKNDDKKLYALEFMSNFGIFIAAIIVIIAIYASQS